ncbi:MAG: hypothetical protein N2482_03055 [Patescibacteria group bacterium]|nr:hypothetical protein [Patescibacteria group bacterium]
MKKETIIAIILGIVLGITSGVMVVFESREKDLKKNKPMTNQQKTIVIPTIKISPILTFLEIDESFNGKITAEESIKIKGKTNKNSLIIIQSAIKETLLTNEKESFEIDFPLALGENVIRITVYPKDKTASPLFKELKIYYLENL